MQAIVTATMAFLNSLSGDQRKKVFFPFISQEMAAAVRFKRNGIYVRLVSSGGEGGGGPQDGPDSGHGNHNPINDQRMRQRPGGNSDRLPDGPGMRQGGGFVGGQYDKAVWSSYPVSDVPRPRLTMGCLNSAQRAAAMQLLQVLLSPEGYQKILDIMRTDQAPSDRVAPFASGSNSSASGILGKLFRVLLSPQDYEKVLDIMGADQAPSDGVTPFASGTGSYTIGIFGTPSVSTPWMLQFGGHHLRLNVVMAGEHGVIQLPLTGAQPPVYTLNSRPMRVLAAENDKAFALLNALDEVQHKQAILNYEVGYLVLGSEHAGEKIVPEGLKASAMNDKQRAMLLDLISEWISIINDTYASPRMAEIKAGLDDTYFAWTGPSPHEPGRNGSAYYRIQGPKVLIEFVPDALADACHRRS
jgi:hypothetical protein